MQIVAERAIASSGLPHAATLEPVSTEDLPLQGTVPPALPAASTAHGPPSGSGMPSSQHPLACPAVSPGSSEMGAGGEDIVGVNVAGDMRGSSPPLLFRQWISWKR